MKKINVKKKINKTIRTITSLFSDFISIDSREIFNKTSLSSITAKEIQIQIETLNNTRQIKHSFFHNTYIKEVLIYADRPLKFYNCIFDIQIIDTTELKFFSHHSFKKCTIYYSTPLFDKKHSMIIEHLLQANDCAGIKTKNIPYSYEIFKNKKIQNKNFNMLNINNCDLSNFKLPNNRDFFKNLDKNIIENVKFPTLNLENYDINNIHFLNCEFESNSTIPHKFLNTNFKNCILPIIHFESGFNYKINSCTIHKESSFPKDEDFFINSFFKECNMPKKDYSFYKIDKFSFEKCYFDKDAILPNDIFNQENLNILLTLSNIPDTVIGDIAQYTYIIDKDIFLKKYNHILSIEERFLLENFNF